jgi:hypothetical protein
MRTYEITFRGETRYQNSSRVGIVQAGVGVFSDGSWFSTLTTQADPIKAARSARSTNKYAVEYTAVPVTEVEYTGAAYKRSAS